MEDDSENLQDRDTLKVRVNGTDSVKTCPPLQNVQDMVPARLVLYMLSFSGFLVSFMMRTDINIAIVAMAKLSGNSTTLNSERHCPTYETNTAPQNATVFKSPAESMEEGEFEWDSTIQTWILGSFYWCYVFSQVIGGQLTQYFGTKVVFGYSQFVTALCSLLIPQAAVTHYYCVIFLRCIQGIASGLTWPAMYALVGKWIPSRERSRFMSSFQGFSFGIGLTYPLCGFLIAHYGWRVVFYTTGSLGIAWCFVWWVLAFDAPQKHPRITKKELDYIECTIGDAVIISKKNLKVPWLSIFKSMPAWSIGITTFGRIWVHYTFIISGPLYMKTVLGFNIQTNGLMSGIPFLCSYFASVIFCYTADYLIIHKIMTLTNMRKMFTALSQVVPGALLLLIVYFGCDRTNVLITWFFAVTLITASYAGAMANIVDIAPNFAGPVLAFAQTIHMTASFLSPLVAGMVLQDSKNLDQWKAMFQIASAIAISTYLSFQIFGTAEVQSWNKPESNSAIATKLPNEQKLLPDSTEIPTLDNSSRG